MPALAGIQFFRKMLLDSRLRGNDNLEIFKPSI